MSRKVGLRTISGVGVAGCVLKISVLVNSNPSSGHAVVIDGRNYYNGNSFIIAKGVHTLTWLSGNGVVFDSWAVSGNINIDEEDQTLTVNCGGTLTLNLLACPSAGEQIVNGDFENGTIGWNNLNGLSYLSTDYAYSPTHSVFTYSDAIGFYQTINNIPVACVESLTFRTISPYGSGTVTIEVSYSDGSSSEMDVDSSGTWTNRDATGILTANKVIVEIRFKSSTNNPTYVDDVSLIC